MQKQPNLLFLFSDQHAAQVAGCYGDRLASTPNLDRLAADGLTFDSAYCPSPICTPSRMSMLTGLYPHHSKVWGNQDMLHPGLPTMAHALGAAGYEPQLVGRLHSVGPDQLLGYSSRTVGDHHPNWSGLERMDMGPLEGAASPDRRSLRNSGAGSSAYEVKDHAVVASARDSLDAVSRRMKNGEIDRFAMTVGLMLPHPPYVASPDDYARYAGKVGLARKRGVDPAGDHPWLAKWRRHRDILDVSEEEELRARAGYYGLVTSMDRMIGDILDHLDELGLADNTLVVYASDHGDQLGEHGLWWKHTFFEESVRVPLIMRWPGNLPQGERRRQVVNLTDVTATILDALSAPELPGADGVSFLEVARDGDAPWRNRTFSEYCVGSRLYWGIPGTSQIRMIREGRYKLIYYHGMPSQLFDLENDPDELHDLGDDPRLEDVRAQLEAEILKGWDPAAIEREIENALPQKALLKDWAERAKPESRYFWQMKPEHNRLDPAAAQAPQTIEN